MLFFLETLLLLGLLAGLLTALFFGFEDFLFFERLQLPEGFIDRGTFFFFLSEGFFCERTDLTDLGGLQLGIVLANLLTLDMLSRLRKSGMDSANLFTLERLPVDILELIFFLLLAADGLRVSSSTRASVLRVSEGQSKVTEDGGTLVFFAALLDLLMLLELFLSDDCFFMDLRAEGYKQSVGFSTCFLATDVFDFLTPVEGSKQPSSSAVSNKN